MERQKASLDQREKELKEMENNLNLLNKTITQSDEDLSAKTRLLDQKLSERESDLTEKELKLAEKAAMLEVEKYELELKSDMKLESKGTGKPTMMDKALN